MVTGVWGYAPKSKIPGPAGVAGSGICRKCGYTSYACYVTSFAPLVGLLSEKWHKKSRKPVKDFLLGGAADGRLVFCFESSGQVGSMTVCFNSFTYNNYFVKLISISPFSTLNSILLELSMTLSFKLLSPFSVLTTMR